MNINDITITSLETITAFNITTGDYLFTLDELQSATIAQSQESTEITGKAGRKLATLKRNKAVTVSGTNGLISGGLLELQTGSNFKNDTTEVLWTDYLKVSGYADATGGTTAVPGKAKTTYKAVGTAGNEIEALYLKNSDGTLGDKLEQSNSTASGKFTYNPSDKTLTFFTDIGNDTELVVYYKRKIKADTLSNESDKYSGKCTLYIDAMAEDKCANVYRIQFYIPKADFSGELSFEMGDNQSVHAFEAEALAGACGAGGVLWTYTIFGSNTTDAE